MRDNGYASLVGPIAREAVARSPRLVQPAISGAAVLGGSRSRSTRAAGAARRRRSTTSGPAATRTVAVCAPIAGANTDGHVIGAGDVDACARRDRAGEDRGCGARGAQMRRQAPWPAARSPQRPGPLLTAPPTSAAAAREGEQLTGLPEPGPARGRSHYGYQWYRCDPSGAHCKSIHGATKATYTEVAKDVGQTLGLAVRASDDNGTSTAYASLLGPVAVAERRLSSSTAQPTLSGTPQPGRRSR